jgi:predicted SAM-dependent methyltransferase
MAAWEAADGHIRRSARHDRRNADGMLRYTSLIVDGIA